MHKNVFNYRPIVLVSVLSKLFTSILTDRLLSWSEDEDTLIDNQFGFRSGKSTIDAIFTIQGIISHQLENKEKRFCAFVDFRNAFDKVDRKILMCKLMKNGINSKFVSIVKSVYASVELCEQNQINKNKHPKIQYCHLCSLRYHG
jgi:hypothetical protein